MNQNPLVKIVRPELQIIIICPSQVDKSSMQDTDILLLPVGHISWHISKGGCSGGLHLSRPCLSNCRTGFCALGLPLISCFLGHFGAAEPDAGSLLPCCQAFNAAAAHPNSTQQPAFAVSVLNRRDCGRPPGNSGGKTPRKKRRRGHHLNDVSQDSVHSGSEVFDQMHDCVGETQDVTSDVPMVLFFLVASIQIILLDPLRPQLSITHCSSLWCTCCKHTSQLVL